MYTGTDKDMDELLVSQIGICSIISLVIHYVFINFRDETFISAGALRQIRSASKGERERF
ncbi:hypothetical protein C7212DRAFT_315170 [Tuber magnatum]|uniref:Uncharacterized protein n=1 Tax=Tuber magnatum TaxID=42249 RepID=A0A317SUT0_9PEZI|nr:hypothetical protein C7212DRAFT_315170 [Tuber magnatum]